MNGKVFNDMKIASDSVDTFDFYDVDSSDFNEFMEIYTIVRQAAIYNSNCYPFIEEKMIEEQSDSKFPLLLKTIRVVADKKDEWFEERVEVPELTEEGSSDSSEDTRTTDTRLEVVHKPRSIVSKMDNLVSIYKQL